MSMLSNPAFGPRVALIYVTVGALMDVWVAVYYFTLDRGHQTDGKEHNPEQIKFWLLGLFLTGLTLVILGMLLGPLGRAARKAELPPSDATAAEASIQQNAAAHPQPVVAGGGVAAPGMAPGMMPGMNPAAPQGNMNMVPGAVPQVPGAPNGPQGPNPYARQY